MTFAVEIVDGSEQDRLTRVMEEHVLHALRRLLPARRKMRFAAWQVEITTRCPLACRMCIRGSRPWRDADMSLEDFRKLVPHLRDVAAVVLQGWGEPLLHRDLAQIVRVAKDAGGRRPAPPQVGFVTSGMGMDDRYAAELVGAGLDFIGFSLAGTTSRMHAAIRVRSDLDQLMRAVEHVRAAKQDRALQRPRVHLVYLMLKENVHELPGLPDLASRVGAEEIVLTNLIDIADESQERQRVFASGDEQIYGDLLRETERVARDRGIAVRAAALAPDPVVVCEEDPLRNLFVSVDGDVSPCVYLCPPVRGDFVRRYCGEERRIERLSFGNIFTEQLEEVWNAPSYVAFREQFRRRKSSDALFALVRATSPDPEASPLLLPDPPLPCRSCHKMLGV